jgi:hypothetical protein
MLSPVSTAFAQTKNRESQALLSAGTTSFFCRFYKIASGQLQTRAPYPLIRYLAFLGNLSLQDIIVSGLHSNPAFSPRPKNVQQVVDGPHPHFPLPSPLIGGGAQPTEMSRCKNTLSKVHVRTFVEVEFHPTSKNNRRVSFLEIYSALFMVYIEPFLSIILI